MKLLKNTKFNALNTTVNNLEKKIPDATTLIHINQCNTDKQKKQYRKKLEMLIKTNKQDTSGLVTTTAVKLVKLRIKFEIILNILLLENLIS